MFDKVGSAGGHKIMVRAEIPLEEIKPLIANVKDVEQYVPNRLKQAGRNS